MKMDAFAQKQFEHCQWIRSIMNMHRKELKRHEQKQMKAISFENRNGRAHRRSPRNHASSLDAYTSMLRNNNVPPLVHRQFGTRGSSTVMLKY
jgi:hypothetical protein